MTRIFRVVIDIEDDELVPVDEAILVLQESIPRLLEGRSSNDELAPSEYTVQSVVYYGYRNDLPVE